MTAAGPVETRSAALLRHVEGAVRQASLRTGVDFSYLLTQARIESGLNPTAHARTSSATGLYQFTSATWLDTVARHGAANGMGWAARALRHGAAALSGEARSAILALRHDATASAAMAAEFAADNKARLEGALGHAVGATELYLAHFLGAGGATRFLKAHAADANGSAAAVLPHAAHANHAIFFAPDGAARSLSEVYQRFAAKFDTTPAPAPAPPPALPPLTYAQADPGVVPGIAVQSARLAYELLAGLGG